MYVKPCKGSKEALFGEHLNHQKGVPHARIPVAGGSALLPSVVLRLEILNRSLLDQGERTLLGARLRLKVSWPNLYPAIDVLLIVLPTSLALYFMASFVFGWFRSICLERESSGCADGQAPS